MTDLTPVEVDASGLQCPMPLLLAKRALNTMESGQQLRVIATDQGSIRDFKVFSEQSPHRLISTEDRGGTYIHLLERG